MIWITAKALAKQFGLPRAVAGEIASDDALGDLRSSPTAPSRPQCCHVHRRFAGGDDGLALPRSMAGRPDRTRRGGARLVRRSTR